MRNICILPKDSKVEDAARRDCQNGSHFHMRRRDVLDSILEGRMKWLVVGEVARRIGVYAQRGLSCLVGAELAQAVYSGDPTA